MPSEHDIEQARSHKMWPYFVEACEEEGYVVDPEGHPDDWFPFFEWFMAGAIAQMKVYREE